MKIEVNDSCVFETQCLNNSVVHTVKAFWCSPVARLVERAAHVQSAVSSLHRPRVLIRPVALCCMSSAVSHSVSCLSSPVSTRNKAMRRAGKKKRETFLHIYFCSGDKSLQELLSPLLTGNPFTKQNGTRYHSHLIGWNRRSNAVQGLTVKF